MSEVTSTSSPTTAVPQTSAPKPAATRPAASSGGTQKVSIRDFAKGINVQSSEDGVGDIDLNQFADNSPAEEPVETSADDISEELSEQPEEGQVEELEETGEEDWSWAEQLKAYREGVHNIPLADLLQALSEGRLPDALLPVLKVKLKNGDEEWEDTIENARAGNMRYRDYTKKRQQDAREKEEWLTEKSEITGLMHGWKGDESGKSLLNGLKRMGFPVLQAAKLLAEEHRKLASMDPMARELYEQKQKAEDELERFKYEQQKQQRLKEQTDGQAQIERRIDWASKTGHAAFQRLGVPVNKGTWGLFLREFKTLTEANPGVDWTEDMIQIAVGAVKEEYEELRQQMGVAPQQPPAKKPAPQAAPARQQVVASPARQQLAASQKFDSGKTPAAKGPANAGKVKPKDFLKKFGGR